MEQVRSSQEGFTIGPSNAPALPADFRITGSYTVENTAKVIPPRRNGSCEQGAIVASLGTGAGLGSPDDTGSLLLSRPLMQNNLAGFDLTTLGTGTPYGGTTGFPVLTSQEAVTTTDNQIARLNDGTLLVARIVKTWAPLPSSVPWANVPVSFGDPATPQNGERNELLFLDSADCGQSWQRYGTLDPGLMANGVYAWPEPSCYPTSVNLSCQTICTGTLSVDGGPGDPSICANRVGPLWTNGGWDRPELYADPFSSWVFVSMAAASGPVQNPPPGLKPVNTALVLGSTGAANSNLNTSTWTVLASLPESLPWVMTTTPNGRLFAFSCNGAQPTVYYTTNPSDPTTFISSGVNLNAVNGIPPCGTSEVDIGTNETWAISRMSAGTNDSVVRVVYPTLNSSGTQSLAVVTVSVNNTNPTAAPAVVAHGVIDPADAGVYSAKFPTFIEPNFFDTPFGFQTNTAALYWIEATSNAPLDPQGRVMFKLFGDQFGVSGATGPGPYVLSTSSPGGIFSVPANFTIGDYMTGGFFWDKRRLNFLAQWVEPDGIHANVIAVSPTQRFPHQLGVPGDLNGDGTADIVALGVTQPTLGGRRVALAPVALSGADGTFTVLAPRGSIGASQSVTGDFNGDGITDVVGVDPNGSIWLANGNGDGTFGANQMSSTPFGPFGNESSAMLLAGDFDGDGYTDFLATGVSWWQTVPVAFSKGDGTFFVTNSSGDSNPFVAAIASQAFGKVVIGDFDGDGRDDIAATGGPGWNTLPVAFSKGDGTFHATNDSTTFQAYSGLSGVKVYAGDFDGDGRSDIVALGTWPAGLGSIPIAFSNGNGSFRIVDIPNNADNNFFAEVAAQPSAQVIVGDFNGDGYDDLVATGGFQWSGGPPWTTLPVAFSNGDGTFTTTNSSTTFQAYTQAGRGTAMSSWK